MKETDYEPFGLGPYRTVCALMLMCAWMPSYAFGQVHFDAHCSEPVSHHGFIETAHKHVEQGADREKVLNVLSCIAESDDSEIYTDLSSSAVRAMFAVAKDDAEIRQRLTELTGRPTVTGTANRQAYELLVYVADDATIDVLLQRVQKEPRTENWLGSFLAMKELGDPRFGKWAESLLAEGQPDYLEYFLEQAVLAGRDRHDPKEALRRLESGDEKDLDPAWLARQALRHGATREEIREAIFERSEGRTWRRLVIEKGVELVRLCDEIGLSIPEEMQSLSAYKKIIDKNAHMFPPLYPPWANARIAEKRAAFYKFDRIVKKQEE